MRISKLGFQVSIKSLIHHSLINFHLFFFAHSFPGCQPSKMAKVDADISYLLSHIIIPVLIFILASRYFFGLRLKKLNSMIMRRMCTHLHHTYLEKEKQLLFEHLGDLKRCCSGPFSILEIGVGGGENFKFYPKGTQFSCVDPNRHHDECIKMKLEKHRHIKLVECLHAYAEDMPDIKSNSYNVVVSTLTLCTVRDPAAVLGEIHRVLKPVGI